MFCSYDTVVPVVGRPIRECVTRIGAAIRTDDS